ncbi:hypothetical protein [Pantoea cypripedii]|nr:hypothetical protein [Pantoea cypripedii]MBP2200559.1 hypothetical protein [Pantoea cypripedii]
MAALKGAARPVNAPATAGCSPLTLAIRPWPGGPEHAPRGPVELTGCAG